MLKSNFLTRWLLPKCLLDYQWSLTLLDWYSVVKSGMEWGPVYTKGEGVVGTQNISEVWREPGNQIDNGSYEKVHLQTT